MLGAHEVCLTTGFIQTKWNPRTLGQIQAPTQATCCRQFILDMTLILIFNRLSWCRFLHCSPQMQTFLPFKSTYDNAHEKYCSVFFFHPPEHGACHFVVKWIETWYLGDKISHFFCWKEYQWRVLLSLPFAYRASFQNWEHPLERRTELIRSFHKVIGTLKIFSPNSFTQYDSSTKACVTVPE